MELNGIELWCFKFSLQQVTPPLHSQVKEDMNEIVSIVPFHRLFNWLQNLNRTVLIDIREAVKFNKSHLYQSVSIEDPCLEDRLSNRNAKTVVFIHSFEYLTSSCVDEFYQRYNLGAVIKCDTADLFSCNYDKFCERYRKHASLFERFQDGVSPRLCYPNEIIPEKIYLGNARQAGDSRVLQDLSISHIVDASGMKASQHAARINGIKYMPINIEDSPSEDISIYFEEVVEFINSAIGNNVDNKANKVLVHCQAGVSRGCSLVIAYMLKSGYSRSLADAMSSVLVERPWVCPNPSFRKQLREYEAALGLSRSFLDDNDHLSMISSHFSGNASNLNAVMFDDTPVTAGRNTATLDELIANDEVAQKSKATDNLKGKPNRAPRKFLRRGEGKTSKHLSQSKQV